MLNLSNLPLPGAVELPPLPDTEYFTRKEKKTSDSRFLNRIQPRAEAFPVSARLPPALPASGGPAANHDANPRPVDADTDEDPHRSAR